MNLIDLISSIDNNFKSIQKFIFSYSKENINNIIKIVDTAIPALIDQSYNQDIYNRLSQNKKKILNIFFTLLEIYQEDSNKCYGYLVNSSDLIVTDDLHKKRLKAIKMIRKINTSTDNISNSTKNIIDTIGSYENTNYSLDTINNHKILSSLIIINLYNYIKNQTQFNERTGDSANRILAEIAMNYNIELIRENMDLIISSEKKKITKKLLL